MVGVCKLLFTILESVCVELLLSQTQRLDSSTKLATLYAVLLMHARRPLVDPHIFSLKWKSNLVTVTSRDMQSNGCSLQVSYNLNQPGSVSRIAPGSKRIKCK
jgi:hypothetical protein